MYITLDYIFLAYVQINTPLMYSCILKYMQAYATY
jgi:hypothetical protein